MGKGMQWGLVQEVPGVAGGWRDYVAASFRRSMSR